MMYVPLEKLINLYDGYRKGFRLSGHNILLIQEEGKIWAVDGICPHLDRSLLFGSVTNGSIRCPAHNFEFDLNTGKNTVFHGKSCDALKCYSIVYMDNTVGIDLPEP